MHPLIVTLALALSFGVAGAEPVRFHDARPIAVGGLRLTAVACTLDGEPLTYSREIMHAGVAVLPHGDVAIVDGAGRLRRYRPGHGKACDLKLDTTFGKDGMLELGADATADFETLAVDRAGTLYISRPKHQPWRVTGDRAEPMCGDDVRVNASPLSDFVWRHQFANPIVRERGDCSDARKIASGTWDELPSQLWAIDDRAAAYGHRDGRGVLVLFGPDGAETRTLPLPEPDQSWDPMKVVRCGAAICALNYAQIAIWSAAPTARTVVLQELLGLDAGYVWPIDFASGPDGAYLIVEDNDPDAPHDGTRPATVFRIDGLR